MVVHNYSPGHSKARRFEEPRVVEAIWNRYRNLIALAMAVVAQLLLLAWQVRTKQDVRLIRVWAVTAVTPMAGVVEAVRHNTIGFLEDYFILLDVREQNQKLRSENSRLKMDNIYYRNQLQTAEHARALAVFQEQTPSHTVAARIIGNGTASSAQVVFIDRGSTSGIENGMAVVTPEGIVGKVVAVYPLAAQVLLVTDPTFAVGVESQKGRVHGTLRCNGLNCTVEYIQNEEKVDPGEWFYTSGEDRIFPKGFPVGTASSVKIGQFMKEIHLRLSGAPGGVDEVLVVIQGVHQQIPANPPPQQKLAKSLPPPPNETPVDDHAPAAATEADKIREQYQEIGKQQNHQYGTIGSNMPNFAGSSPAAAQPKTDKTPPVSASAAPGIQQTPATSGSAPPKVTAPKPAVAPPPVLGARPRTESDATAATKQAQPALKRPSASQPPDAALPLGAPRQKAPNPPPASDGRSRP